MRQTIQEYENHKLYSVNKSRKELQLADELYILSSFNTNEKKNDLSYE